MEKENKNLNNQVNNKASDKSKAKKKKRRRVHPIIRILKAFGTLVLSVILLVIITVSILATALTVYVMNYMDESVDIDISNMVLNYTSYFMAEDANGNWIEYGKMSEGGERRVWVDLEQVPDNMIFAVVYPEDKRFFTHDGVDFQRTFLAMANLIMHFWSSEQGASTITQQVVKNVTGDDAASGTEGIGRKFREIFRAMNVEKNYSKDDILEAYLNLIHLGNNTNGVQAAANFYFDKDVSELTLGECSSIAAVIKSPAANNPLSHYRVNKERQVVILNSMLENGAISTEEFDAALIEKLDFDSKTAVEDHEDYVIGLDYLLEKGYITKEVYNKALRDENYNEQEALEQDALEAENEANDVIEPTEENKYSNISAYSNFNEVSSYYCDAAIKQAIEIVADQYGISLEDAEAKLKSGGFTVYLNVDLDMQIELEEKFMNPETFSDQVIEGEVPQASGVIMDYSGNVLAIAGGVGAKPSARCYNYATDATRPAGSTIKPIAAYGPAIELDLINWSTRFKDEPPIEIFDEETDEVRRWPRNYSTTGAEAWSEEYNFTFECLQRSLNTTSAQILQLVTRETSFEFVKDRLHLPVVLSMRSPETGRILTDMDYSPLAVGQLSVGVSIYDLVSAYQIFGNQGKYCEPSFINKIVDKNGNTIYQQRIYYEQAISEESAYIMNRLMKTVVTGARGTGRAAALAGTELVAKTGTSEEWKDLLFIGCTPDYVSGIWYGYDTPARVYTGTYYSSSVVWKNVFGEICEAGPTKTFGENENVVKRYYCTKTGLIASEFCPHSLEYGYYKKTAIPAICSGVHVDEEEPDDDDTQQGEGGENGEGGEDTPRPVDPNNSNTVNNETLGNTFEDDEEE